MPDVKISAGADPVTLVATDKVPLARSASTTAYAATVAEIATYANGAYVPPYYTGTPSMDATGAPGTAAFVSRGDHVHPSDMTRAPIAGITNGSNAAAGQVGEYLSAQLAYASRVSVTNNTTFDLLTLALTAGDWDVSGGINFVPTSATSVASFYAWCNTASVTVPDPSLHSSLFLTTAIVGISYSFPTQPLRISVSVPAIAYLSGVAAFTASTLQACGFLRARRVR